MSAWAIQQDREARRFHLGSARAYLALRGQRVARLKGKRV